MPLQANSADYYPRNDQVLGIVTGISLVTAATYLCFKLLTRPALLKYILFENFSAFGVGAALPNGITFQYGSDAAFANMQPSTNLNGQFVNVVWPQSLTAGTPYVGGGQTVTLSVTAGVAATGTCQATFVGPLL